MSAEFVARTYDTDHRAPLPFIWSNVLQHKWVGIWMITGAFANAALAGLVPVLAGIALNAIVERGDLRTVGWIALATIVSQLIRGGVQFIRNYGAETFAQRIERDVRDELYANLLGKSMTFHDFRPVGEIMVRVNNDVRELYFFFTPGINLLVGSSMFVLIPVISSPLISPQLILVPLIFLITFTFFQVRYLIRLHEVAEKVRYAFGQVNAQLAETLDGIEIVKGSAQEPREMSSFGKRVDALRSHLIEQGDAEAAYFGSFLFSLAILGGFLHAVILYQNGVINVGQIVQFMGQIALYGFPIFSSQFSLSRLALGYASAERILDVINDQTDLDQNQAGHSADITGQITFEDVDFGYLPDEPVLHGISFYAKAGQTVAIAGQTGSGKSSVAKLINRTYDVSSGRVLIDGVDVRAWNLDSLRSQISIIEQEIFLFSRSVAENICFGNPSATMEQVIEAAKRAQAHDFIMEMPDGYDTVIGQRGVTLSGGQRQRLAIARAFLTNPSILILDDSTSAIDSATEDKIQRAIFEVAQGRTTILITHRLSQIRWADHIVVLRKGKVVAQGTHEELMESSKTYRRIFSRYEAEEPAAEAK